MSFTLPEALLDPDDGAALELLARYYRPGAYTGAWFDTWDTTGRRDQETNTFTVDDLTAVTCLSVSVSARAARRLLVDESEYFSRLLQAVGPDRELADEAQELGPSWPGWVLQNALQQLPDVGVVTGSKLFARKRPRLRPVYDSVVADVLGTRQQHWEPIRRALRQDGGALQRRLVQLREAAHLPAAVTALRVLDVIAWMEGKDRGDTGASALS